MRLIYGGIAVVVAVVLVQPVAYAKAGNQGAPGGKGTSIMHFAVGATMQPTGPDADAVGSAVAMDKEQGNAQHQSLDIAVANLDANATYDLSVVVGDETNLVTQFTTDATGAAQFHYVKQGNGNASPEGDPLPPELDPVSGIDAILIGHTSMTVIFIPPGTVIVVETMETILAADFLSPDSLQYLVKRGLDNDGVEPGAAASLQLKSNGTKDQFRLRAVGLTPGAAYQLAIDGVVVEALLADSRGNLSVRSLPAGVPDVVGIESVAILDGTNASVLSTTLP